MTANYNIHIDKGSYFSLVWQLENTDIDLTGASVKMQIKADKDSSVIVEATTQIDVVERKFLTELTQDKTALIKQDSVFDLDLILADDTILSLLTGNVIIREKINDY